MSGIGMEEKGTYRTENAERRCPTGGVAPEKECRPNGVCLRGGNHQDEYGLTRSVLRSAGVEVQAIRDISFVGNRVCSFLVFRDYKEKLVRILTSEGSTHGIGHVYRVCAVGDRPDGRIGE